MIWHLDCRFRDFIASWFNMPKAPIIEDPRGSHHKEIFIIRSEAGAKVQDIISQKITWLELEPIPGLCLESGKSGLVERVKIRFWWN